MPFLDLGQDSIFTLENFYIWTTLRNRAQKLVGILLEFYFANNLSVRPISLSQLLTNLRAQLESNKIFNVIINSFTLLNCRPES